jgi:hypothetical protein
VKEPSPQEHVPSLTGDRLAATAVAGVPIEARIRVALLVTQVASHLGLQAPFEDRLDKFREQTAGTGELHLIRIDLIEQRVQLPEDARSVADTRFAGSWSRRLNGRFNGFRLRIGLRMRLCVKQRAEPFLPTLIHKQSDTLI